MPIPNTYLQSIIDGEIGVIDSTQAVAVARELLAARKFLEAYEGASEYEEFDAWRKAAE